MAGITAAASALRDKRLDGKVRTAAFGIVTWREYVEKSLANGGMVEKVECNDDALRANLQRSYEVMNRGFNIPWGNNEHPKTIAAQALKDRLAGRITSPQYRLYSDSGRTRFSVLSKTTYAYGLSIQGTPHV